VLEKYHKYSAIKKIVEM